MGDIISTLHVSCSFTVKTPFQWKKCTIHILGKSYWNRIPFNMVRYFLIWIHEMVPDDSH